MAHFRASSAAGAAVLSERLEAIKSAAARSASAASAADYPSLDEESGSDRTRAILSKAREAKEAAAAWAAASAVSAAAAVARKKNRRGGKAAVQEIAAAVPWYGKYVPIEDNALTLPEVPLVPVEEERREPDDGRRGSRRTVSWNRFYEAKARGLSRYLSLLCCFAHIIVFFFANYITIYNWKDLFFRFSPKGIFVIVLY